MEAKRAFANLIFLEDLESMICEELHFGATNFEFLAMCNLLDELRVVASILLENSLG